MAKKKKEKKPLHISTMRALGLAFLLSITALVFTFDIEWGKNEKKLQDQADTEVFKTFDLATLDGGRLSAKDLSSTKISGFNVWGTDCPPCINEFPELEELNNTYDDSDFILIGIPVDVTNHGEGVLEDRREEAKRLLEASGCSFTNIICDKAMDSFLYANIAGTPTTYFVDSEGNILKVVTGARDYETYKTIVDELLEEVK